MPDGSLDFAYVDGDHTLRGITIDLVAFHPATDSPEDLAAVARSDSFRNRWILDPVLRGEWLGYRRGRFLRAERVARVRVRDVVVGLGRFRVHHPLRHPGSGARADER